MIFAYLVITFLISSIHVSNMIVIKDVLDINLYFIGRKLDNVIKLVVYPILTFFIWVLFSLIYSPFLLIFYLMYTAIY